jgi:hypothetical protein
MVMKINVSSDHHFKGIRLKKWTRQAHHKRE